MKQVVFDLKLAHHEAEQALHEQMQAVVAAAANRAAIGGERCLPRRGGILWCMCPPLATASSWTNKLAERDLRMVEVQHQHIIALVASHLSKENPEHWREGRYEPIMASTASYLRDQYVGVAQ